MTGALILYIFCSITMTVSVDTAVVSSVEPDWLLNFDEAKARAADKGHPILMVFSGSDWCRPCILLTNELFNTEEFKSFAGENLILLKLDFPATKKNQLSPEQKQHNERLAKKYNSRGSFPLAVLLDAEGNVLGSFGYSSGELPSGYIDQIRSIYH